MPTHTANTFDIFISHERKDRVIAERVSERLREAGITVWSDRRLQGGDDYRTKIDEALRASRCVVTLWSQASILSKWVEEESQHGVDRQAFIPVDIDGARPPIGFRHVQSCMLREWDGDRNHTHFISLLEAVRAKLNALRPPSIGSGGLTISSNINEVFAQLANRAASGDLDNCRVLFIQHSSEKAHNLVNQLIGRHIDVDLFVQSPSVSSRLVSWNKSRIEDRVRKYMRELTKSGYRGNFRLSTYQAPASANIVAVYRGSTPEVIAIGWYTYAASSPICGPGELDIIGAENPCVQATRGDSSLDTLSAFVRQTELGVLREAAGPTIEVQRCQTNRPMVLVLMGVAGSGKTTAGLALEAKIGWTFVDADRFHHEADKEAMGRNEPLTEDQRALWIERVLMGLETELLFPHNVILAYSALGIRHRQTLSRLGRPVKFVYLRGDKATLQRRLEQRSGHFAGPGLLDSQLESLEEPSPAEATIIDIRLSRSEITAAICNALALLSTADQADAGHS